jgi:hypothetical protein
MTTTFLSSLNDFNYEDIWKTELNDSNLSFVFDQLCNLYSIFKKEFLNDTVLTFFY